MRCFAYLGVFSHPGTCCPPRTAGSPRFVVGGVSTCSVPRAPVLVQVLESGQCPFGCALARVCTPSTVVLSRPLQQPYTPPASSEVTYELRRFTKKSNDSLVGQRQSFVVVQQAYDTSKPRVSIHARERVEVEPAWIRRGWLGGFQPQLANPGEVEARLDVLDVREDEDRHVQAGIKGRFVRVGHRRVGSGSTWSRYVAKCREVWRRRGFFSWLLHWI